MTPELVAKLLAVVVASAGVLCAIGVAVLGVVWRLGTKQATVVTKIESFEKALARSDEAGEKWNKQVIDAMREICLRVDAHDLAIGELRNQWKTAHRIVQKVSSLDTRLAGIEAVCGDRIRCEQSQPFDVEDGAPLRRRDGE